MIEIDNVKAFNQLPKGAQFRVPQFEEAFLKIERDHDVFYYDHPSHGDVECNFSYVIIDRDGDPVSLEDLFDGCDNERD